MSEAVESLTYEDFIEIKKSRRLTEEEKKRYEKVRRKRHYVEHGEEERASHKIWVAAHKDKIKEYNKQHQIKDKEYRMQKYDNLKINAYNALGGCKCEICGNTNLVHLNIDHRNNDGSNDRKKIALYTFYRFIVNRILPEEYIKTLRVLCWNCNKGRVRDYMDIPYENQTYSQRHIHKLWKQAYEFFGPCATCGETNLKFLSISHIHDNGAERRRNGEKQGPKLLSEFRKMGWPESLKEDFCFECFNCNCSRGHRVPKPTVPSSSSE